jgi:hypothetical protein
LFLKLDIAKAFDSVRWDFLLEVLQQFGFGNKWRSWISTLLSTSSTATLINGARGRWFNHYRGLRQGDPLSPMLFILAMEPLQRLFDQAASDGLLSPICSSAAKLRVSLYADDAAVFVQPTKEDVATVAETLELFGQVSGLLTNRSKCAVYPIRCDNINLEEVMEGFQCPIQSFPCNYLGLPLHYRQLRRVDVPPLVDKMSNRLPSWKGRFINRSGRLKLLNAVLSSLPTYFLTMFAPKKVANSEAGQAPARFLVVGDREGLGGGGAMSGALD